MNEEFKKKICIYVKTNSICTFLNVTFFDMKFDYLLYRFFVKELLIRVEIVLMSKNFDLL